MQVFFIVLTEYDVMPRILKKLSEYNFKGTVMHSESIKHALIYNDIEPEPVLFGSISKLVNYEHAEKPTIFVVVKDDKEVEMLRQIVNDATGGITGKGFMFSVPALFIEGLD